MEKVYNLIYKNRDTGEIKTFYRDDKRNYYSEDGTFLNKMDSYTKWQFMGKTEDSYRKEKSSGVGLTKINNIMNEKRDSYRRAIEISPSLKLISYYNGFEEALSIIERRNPEYIKTGNV